MSIAADLEAAKAIDLTQLEDRQKAEPLYDAFIAKHGSCTEPADRKLLGLAYNNRGQIKYMRVDFNEASVDYTQAIECDPQLSVAFYNRGQIHYRLARYEQAVSDFARCLQLEPGFRDAVENMAQAQADIDLKERGLNSSYS
ncbi:tetratricopeptide repeat protein 32-like [Sycon ciliatum]|uniref:tetratricopeptide repeat protein 32-like n=1 Tax=Sycon ciliatum TaxID=27933 RepID=UPI0031F623D6